MIWKCEEECKKGEGSSKATCISLSFLDDKMHGDYVKMQESSNYVFYTLEMGVFKVGFYLSKEV